MTASGPARATAMSPEPTATVRGMAIGWERHLSVDAPAGIDVLAEESLPRAWRARWLADPAAPVLVEPDGSTMTAGELAERSASVASRFAAAGLESGDRLVLSAVASVDLVVVYVAAHRLGLVIVPMNTAYGWNEVAHIVQNTTPKAAVVDDADRAAAILDAQPGTLILGPAVAAPEGPEPPLDQGDRTSPALICHTSGTTGLPKGALLTSGNLLASAQAVITAWRWTPEDRLALALPLFHLHGLGVGLNGTLVAGASVVLVGPFDPGRVGAAIEDRGATLFFGVPTMYHRFTSQAEVAKLRSLRLCVSGSAPLSTDLHQAITAGSGQRILERYGMTETVMNISNPYEGERRPGTVGFPLPGVGVRLAATDVDAPGEIQVRGPNVFAGYWNDPGATGTTFTDDGWLRTGDVGQRDEDGYMRIVGRLKELIISGGYNVYPREVEDALRRHPAVEDVCVVGVPSDEWGETVAAAVVAREPVTVEGLAEHAAASLASYKRPRVIRFVDDIPRNALGKPLRAELSKTL